MRKLITILAAVALTATPALADGTLPATATVHLGGTITAVGPGSISLQVAKAGKRAASLVGQTVTIGVDSSTEVSGDLQAGARASVAAKGYPDNLVATRIRVAPAAAHAFGGAVTAAGSGSLTIDVDRTGKHDTQLLGQTVIVAVPDGTPITLGEDRTPIALSDIQVGWRAGVSATQDSSGAWTAKRVHAGRGDHWFAGELTAVGSASITVAVKRTGPHDTQLKGQTVTVPVDASTQYVRGKDKTPITLGDLEVGDHVGVVVHAPGGDLSQGMTTVRVHDWRKADAQPEQS